MITAPYNFVPLNKEVFYPDWAEDVSHDVPFEDGESGEIDITITAKSPIFIRDHANPEHFCQYNGQYYIPGSSLKGMLRILIEIMSFSKLKLQDKTLSYRDLNHPSYKKKAMNADKIYMGWLYTNNGQWHIDSVGKITANETRIKYKDMKQYLNEELVNQISRTKEAYKKYNIIKDFSLLKIPEGTIVFTGSTGKKTREFLFPNKIEKTFILEDTTIKTFQEAYYLGTPNESADWKNLWAKKMRNKEKIPVFFQTQNNQVKHFGLSMLYKLPYEHSLQETLERFQDFKQDTDFTETIFGYVNGSKSLKGRIQFSHLKCTQAITYPQTITLPLSTPRATFFPNYIVQTEAEGKTKQFITYDDKHAVLRGYKMYPPRREIIVSDPMCTQNPKICTSFKPLDQNSTFKGKIRFHNIKRAELGALLSSLSFLNVNSDKKYFHKLGMAKAYGFGTVQIDINTLQTTNQLSQSEYIEAFLTLMKKELNISLLSHPRIQAMLKLCSYSFNDSQLKFMDIKGFVNAKKPFNRFVLPQVIPNSHTSKTENILQKPKTENKDKLRLEQPKQSNPISFGELYEKYHGNVKQIASSLKAGHLDALEINKKELAKELIEELKKDTIGWNSQELKNLQRREFLESLSQ